MTATFYEKPVLNSPYSEPSLHHALDEEGQPTDQPPIDGRRRSELMTPVPKPKKRRKASEAQSALDLASSDGISSEEQEYNPTPIINEIRARVADWRKLPSQTDWGVGEQIRCVVSVSMLTEGWDTNTVTHILGIRAFGTQLLCEQVVGRGLRRYSYELNNEGLFNVEYADIMGIPFDFTAKPPKKTTRVHAVKERSSLEIAFPRVVGYRVDLPEERLTAAFTEDSKLVLTPEMVGPGQTLMEGIVGVGVTISVAEAQAKRPSTIAFDLAKHLLYKYFKDEDSEPKLHLFGQIKRVARQWIDEGYLECKGDTGKWMLEYLDIANQASERIYHAIVNSIGDTRRVKAVLDPYNPKGSTSHVGFSTTKDLWTTAPDKSHINYVALDSDWEAEFARAAEKHPDVVSYVKNQGLGMEIPYKDGSMARSYIPDFIVQINDGRGSDDLLNLIVEVKGYRHENVKLKSETVKTQWVPGVNNLGAFGRWAFVEFSDVYEIDKDFVELVDKAKER